MIPFFAIGAVLCSMYFFTNCISIFKKIRRDEPTLKNEVIGAILIGFIIFVILLI